MFCVRHKQPALFDYKQDEPVKAHLILLAHGSKDSNWCRTFELGLGTINNRLEKNASLAYMEMGTAESAVYEMEKVLKLDPTNESAEFIVRSLTPDELK